MAELEASTNLVAWLDEKQKVAPDYSAATFAAACDVSATAVYNWVSGEDEPTQVNAQRIFVETAGAVEFSNCDHWRARFALKNRAAARFFGWI